MDHVVAERSECVMYHDCAPPLLLAIQQNGDSTLSRADDSVEKNGKGESPFTKVSRVTETGKGR